MNSLTARAAQWQHSCGCMLTFHRAAQPERWAELPNRDFHLNLGFLDQLLGHLIRSGWKIVTVEEIVRCLESGEDGARLVNFSIDDCYQDTYEHVVPLFRRHGVPVTLFVTTGIPDGTLELGWAGLESILAGRSSILLGDQTIGLATPGEKRHWFAKITAAWEKTGFERQYLEFCEANRADPVRLREEHAITWEMLEELNGDPLVEIGSHTISHARISNLSADAALNELAGSRERLRSRLGIECRHFAFPYGRSADCGPRDFDLARKAGFASASTTLKGLVQPHQDAFSLPRNTLNGAYRSITYVNTLLSGLGGVAARVLRRV